MRAHLEGVRTCFFMDHATEIQGQKLTSLATGLDNPWQVVLFNDEVHTFDAVILQLQKATGCALERAEQLTLMVHQNGRAIVFIGEKIPATKVSAILQQIGLQILLEKT
jgi:ATP-dependent Clp protease adaptor protein ClpS